MEGGPWETTMDAWNKRMEIGRMVGTRDGGRGDTAARIELYHADWDYYTLRQMLQTPPIGDRPQLEGSRVPTGVCPGGGGMGSL